MPILCTSDSRVVIRIFDFHKLSSLKSLPQYREDAGIRTGLELPPGMAEISQEFHAYLRQCSYYAFHIV